MVIDVIRRSGDNSTSTGEIVNACVTLLHNPSTTAALSKPTRATAHLITAFGRMPDLVRNGHDERGSRGIGSSRHRRKVRKGYPGIQNHCMCGAILGQTERSGGPEGARQIISRGPWAAT